jgi:hypothetical protein
MLALRFRRAVMNPIPANPISSIAIRTGMLERARLSDFRFQDYLRLPSIVRFGGLGEI